MQKLQFKSAVDGFVLGFGEFKSNQLFEPDNEAHAKALLETGHFRLVRVVVAEIRTTKDGE